MARKAQGKNGFIRRWVRRLVLLGVFAALVPTLLVPAYSVINPVSTLMIADVFSAGGYKRTWADFDDIAPVLYQSVLMSEDGQFCSHDGVDWGAVREVVEDFQEGGKPRGASTITMQTAKNLFLWNGRSYVRKALELPIALYIDFILPKRRIMEIYLNIAEWGPGIYGVEAAAQHHFGRSAKNLSRQQAALLAVTLPNPIVRNPRKPSKGMRRLSSIVAKRAQASGAYIKCLNEGN